MQLEALRRSVATTARRLGASGLTPGASGNVSAFDAERGWLALTPSAMEYAAITPADVVVLDLEGRVVEGDRRPSSEADMHRLCYQRRPTLGGLVHTHSPWATTLAVLGQDLPAVHYMVALSGAATVRCAPYHRFGSAALARAADEAMGGGRACLLANHGVLAGGRDPEAALELAVQIEACAALWLRARAVGRPELLSTAQIDEVLERLDDYERQDARDR